MSYPLIHPSAKTAILPPPRETGPFSRSHEISGRRANLAAGLALMLFLLPAAVQAETAEEFFGRGNEAYHQDQFDSSIDLYGQALGLAESTALHYNLGNAFYRNGQIGPAILHYEKALALDPSDPDARRNLSFVREAAELQEPAPASTTQLAMRLPIKMWTWMLVGGFWSALALLVLPGLYGGANILTRIALAVAIAALLSASAALVGYHKISGTCIVLAEDTPLRVSPTPESSERGFLRAGTKASIRKEHGSFVFLDLPDGDLGWVQNSEIGRVWE